MKNSKKGISLIVLIITIIVIIILATAILVSVISNNPISEANKARYESDRDNMQAVFTNTVGKIMAENQGVVNVTAGQINTETTGVTEATGEVVYTVDNATVAENASGTIKFDKGTNDATTYYTGKKLPIYAAGETKWYVDSEGVLSLEVAGVKYGSGEITLTYMSLGNWVHKVSDGTIESHDTEGGICSKCGENVLVPGLYDEDGNMTKSWEQLLADGNLVNNDGVLNGEECCGEGQYEFSGKGKLVVDKSITKMGDFYCSETMYSMKHIKLIILPDTITDIGHFLISPNLNYIEFSNSVTSLPRFTFYAENLKTIRFIGTIEEWNAIEFEDGWNSCCPEITVHCTDGDIIIPAYEG